MENFKIGECVIAIHSGNYNTLEIGKDYIIRDVNFCSKCGRQNIDVGHNSIDTYNSCANSCIISGGAPHGIEWYDFLKFARKQSMSSTEKQHNINIVLKPKEVIKTEELIAN